MIDGHGDAVVSDLSEYHGIDLLRAIRDYTESPRTLLALLSCLRDDSALAASIRDEPRGWGLDRHLLTTVVDAIQANTYVTQAVATQKRPRKPRPLPRPTAPKPKPRVVSVAELNGRR